MGPHQALLPAATKAMAENYASTLSERPSRTTPLSKRSPASRSWRSLASFTPAPQPSCIER